MTDQTTISATDEINRLIDEWLEDKDEFVATIEAEKLLAKLHEQAPDLLLAWHQESEHHWMTKAISKRLIGQRARSVARAFRDATEAAEDGDEEPLRHFAVTYVIDDDNTRRRVADMTGDDHKFVASAYERSGKFDLMMAAFHRAIAKRVGKRRTAEAIDEPTYEALLRSFSNQLTPTA